MRVKSFKHVHFVGIGGYGMSAIARVLMDMGFEVSGSDVSRQELAVRLEERGATVFYGHRAEQVAGADVVVYNTMIAPDNVELMEAKRRDIPVLHRSEMLARLMEDRMGIAVTGAHGKTTTSSMIAYMMERCECEPTFVIGGVVSNLGENARAGCGNYVVAEADESDGSFLHYHPHIAVVTNVEPDHLEHYGGDFSNLLNAYQQFVSQIQPNGSLVTSAEDPHMQKFAASAPCRVVTFSANPDSQANITAHSIHLIDRGSISEIRLNGEVLGTLRLQLPGIHNIMNAMACLAVGLEAGLTFEKMAQALSEFHGAKRRFQVIGDVQNILIIDDYAHHPTEIRATIAAAQATKRRIVAVFQPQRYTRTYFLFDAFSQAFSGADEVVIADIYSPAGERRIEGVTAERLVEQIRVTSNPSVRFLKTKNEVLQYLLSTVQPGDLVLTMGAGDIWQVAHRLSEALKSNPSEARALV
ncbi:UDP-N-acetylmuramate--L-alanine ligase [Alicyclobacillus tolerans]|uniref:UDP-N-acetylmuramate--L-alanine ligase n=1 Tax=Alicyclobacillus tolerans TaxID=90970 RepID=A0A1M6XJG9_9BACL|nr:UDP-N-acetylmuramate--L-alanine ligase [Alicyclobacillus montanus]